MSSPNLRCTKVVATFQIKFQLVFPLKLSISCLCGCAGQGFVSLPAQALRLLISKAVSVFFQTLQPAVVMFQEAAVDQSDDPGGAANAKALLLQRAAEPEVQRLHLHPQGLLLLPLTC